MLRYLTPNSCVQATRITCDVLQEFGIEVQPYPVQWMVNVPSLHYAYISGFRGQEKEDLRKRSAKWIDRADTLGAGWEGHLVGIAEGRWLIDASIDQCASREHGFEIPPEVLVIDMDCLEPRWTPTSSVIGNFTTGIGIEVEMTYQPMEEGAGEYLHLDAWHDDMLAMIVWRIVKAMRSMEIGVGA